jgi:hypothetical protein
MHAPGAERDRDSPVLQPATLTKRDDTLVWPDIRLVGPRRYRLGSAYVVEWEAGGFPRQRLTVPEGFECDGASVPALLEWYLGRERILPAAVPHDWQYAHAGRIPSSSHHYLEAGQWVEANHVWTRRDSDRFFARNLRFCDIRDHQRRSAYRAVRVGGWIPWRQAERRIGQKAVSGVMT